jgi:hypothetical protein
MLIDIGEKIHIAYRMLHEKAIRRHFIGEVIASEGAICRMQGYVFVYDSSNNMFSRKAELRTTIIDLAESGYFVNIIQQNVDIDQIFYKYEKGSGVMATDGKGFELNVHEFGSKA